eukprot:CAMPEP_0195162380 /NCGR_PEP_ID=MMETSP0448-20130528/187638_1 /TAXON_ID=66468 /ORGANISM="Heterocapsa triquestra, Strain CCMP 448" /LENGTH=83 /DNA_ID=CAMNT_0040201179 /DNA_START=344 /DNA_END=596 /DNA_ORIENTATION=-
MQTGRHCEFVHKAAACHYMTLPFPAPPQRFSALTGRRVQAYAFAGKFATTQLQVDGELVALGDDASLMAVDGDCHNQQKHAHS